MASRLALHPDVVHQPIGNELVVLNARSGRYFRLNETGRMVLAGVVDGDDLDAIVERIVATFEVDEGRARSDAEATLSRLEALEILIAQD